VEEVDVLVGEEGPLVDVVAKVVGEVDQVDVPAHSIQEARHVLLALVLDPRHCYEGRSPVEVVVVLPMQCEDGIVTPAELFGERKVYQNLNRCHATLLELFMASIDKQIGRLLVGLT
jgi:hypothetical protein